MILETGTRLGAYEILSPLGAGRGYAFGYSSASSSDLYVVTIAR